MFDVACYCTQSRRLSRALTDTYNTALKPVGLTVAQFSLLRIISRLDAPTIGRVADATGIDRTTLGRNLSVLQRHGWVAVAPGEDGRTRLVALTAEGRDVIARAVPLWEQTQDEVESRLPARLRDALEQAAQLLAG